MLAEATGPKRGSSSGRLDLLGGVADYSGALVLEVPTSCATTVTVRSAPVFRFVSDLGDVEVDARAILHLVELPYHEIRAHLDEHDVPSWARYLLGVALVAARRGLLPFEPFAAEVASTVPRSAGVSSSAALEVATLRALVALHDRPIPALELALLAHEAENHVVGAPCGVMDQVAVSCGMPGEVVPILCRLAEVLEPVRPGPDVVVAGWPSTVGHSVAGDAYGIARAAAAMARRIADVDHGVTVTHTADLPDSVVARLPDVVDGASFLDRWEHLDDPIATVRPDADHPVAAAARFAVGEHRRSQHALTLLRAGDPEHLGPLLAASHAGYGEIGLGHAATDAIADEALSAGAWAARVGGGGCGGTVVVVCPPAVARRIEQSGVELIR